MGTLGLNEEGGKEERRRGGGEGKAREGFKKEGGEGGRPTLVVIIDQSMKV